MYNKIFIFFALIAVLLTISGCAGGADRQDNDDKQTLVMVYCI